MNKTKILLLGALLSVAQIMAPQRANAALIATALSPELQEAFSQMNAEYSTGMKVFAYGSFALFCVIAIPVCVLDETGVEMPTVSADYLKEQGFSDDKIARILDQQVALGKALTADHRAMVIQTGDTEVTLKTDLRGVYPITDEYADFLAFIYGLPSGQ